MPLPGGPAAKAGDKYENKWTVRQLLRLMEGEVEWVHLEPPGAEDHLIEFRIGLPEGAIEVHQVKRQNAGKGRWTVADLQRVMVLDGIARHAVEAGERYRFVSIDSVKGLRELADRARDSESAETFERDFLTSIDLTTDLDDFCDRMGGMSRENAWATLQACRFVPQDEQELTDMVRGLLGARVDGDPAAVQDSLARFVEESIHRRIIGTDVWEFLAGEGYAPADMANDSGLVVRLRQCTDNYLESQPFDIAGVVHERSEAAKVSEILSKAEEGKMVVFLVGAAGSGKTGVCVQVVHRLAGAGWPVLAFRMDKIDPTQRVSELGRQLLGKEKSPVAILAAIASGEDCLLVIEQVDSVSVTSGRNPQFFDCVAKMVREARVHQNMRILLVCRSFDLENDHRFRELYANERTRAETVSVQPFEEEEVRAILAELGADASKFSPQQIELLRLPLHFYLFATARAEEEGEAPAFSNAKELFDAFWRQKYGEVSQVMDAANNFNLILDAVCNEMNAHQMLSVPRAVVREWEADADRMVSANVLINQGGRLSFFHEGFFDYVFARFFSSTGQSLLEFLQGTNQDLFIRAQVRQILTFQRDENFDQYIADIQSVLETDDIRFHVKSLAMGVVGAIRTPTPEEWGVLERQLTSETMGAPDSVRSALITSAPWFRFLMETEALNNWIRGGSEAEQNFAHNFAHQMADQESELVAELLGNTVGESEVQDNRLIQILSWSDGTHRSEALEAVFYLIIEQEERSWTFRHDAFRHFIDGQARKGAEVACRALGRWIEMLLDAPKDENPFLQYQLHEKILRPDTCEELRSRAPVQFVRSVTEPILALMDRHAVTEGVPLYPDKIWRDGFRRLSHHEPEALLRTLAEALIGTAYYSDADYEDAVANLQKGNCRAAHAVLLRGLVVNRPDRIAKAVDYLEGHWNSFGIWYDRFALWDSWELLLAAAPNLSETETKRLEPFILNHWEPWLPYTSEDDNPEKVRGRNREQALWYLNHRRGREQFQLLSALPIDHMSEPAHKRLNELTRKFGEREFERPWSSRGGTVVSPLSGEATKNMNDKQWLSAIRRYATDEDREWRENDILGGAQQLAFAMEVRVKEDSVRFASLMFDFPEDANEAYFSAVLRGVQGGQLPLDLLSDVVQLAHGRPSRPHARGIADVIAGHATHDLPQELLEILSWYALEDPDPQEDIWRQEADSGSKYYGGDPLGHGINTSRGEAAMAIGRLIAADRRYWEHFLPTIDQMVKDPSIAVRSCVAEACAQGLRYDRMQAVQFFLRLCETDDELLGTQTVENFLYFTCVSEFEEVRATLERMMVLAIDGAREIGARQACVAALSEEQAHPLADAAFAGDEFMRKGAADVFSHNLLGDVNPGYCREKLLPIFDDAAKDVRQAASHWLWQAKKGEHLGDALPVAQAYIQSEAFLDDPSGYFRMLEENIDAPPDLLFEAGRVFLDAVGREAGDLRTHSAMSGRSLSELIMRAYRQAEDDADLRGRCLDLFDHLLAVGAYGADQALSTLER